MRQEDQLIEKYGRDPGFRVPDGYFDDLNARIMANLPPYPEVRKAPDLSLWQRVKPYVYLAAMFAGIWLMMSVFHKVSDSGTLSLDNPPAAIAASMASATDDFAPYIALENDYELAREVSANYDSMDDFKEDFGYDLEPEYERMDVSVAMPSPTNEHKTVLI